MMGSRSHRGHRAKRGTMIGWVVTAVALMPMTAAVAQEPPAFRRGLWEFSRTIEGTGVPTIKLTREECTSPTEDMRNGQEQSVKAGCGLSDVNRTGNTYRYSVTCFHGKGWITSRQTVTAQDDTVYTVKGEYSGMGDGKPIAAKEELIAKRLGDCP